MCVACNQGPRHRHKITTTPASSNPHQLRCSSSPAAPHLVVPGVSASHGAVGHGHVLTGARVLEHAAVSPGLRALCQGGVVGEGRHAVEGAVVVLLVDDVAEAVATCGVGQRSGC